MPSASSMKKTYKVEVTRTTFDSMSFNVEANDENEAHEIAIDLACNTSWGTGNVEYEVEYMEELEDQDSNWEENNERQSYYRNN